MTGYKSVKRGRKGVGGSVSGATSLHCTIYIYYAVDHGTPAVGDVWIVMYEIIRGKPPHSSSQQNSLRASPYVAAISHTLPLAEEKRTIVYARKI
jgi:hypothetical protein